eukprot:9489199-Pyramimonas_sp.AAC.1
MSMHTCGKVFREASRACRSSFARCACGTWAFFRTNCIRVQGGRTLAKKVSGLHTHSPESTASNVPHGKECSFRLPSFAAEGLDALVRGVASLLPGGMYTMA